MKTDKNQKHYWTAKDSEREMLRLNNRCIDLESQLCLLYDASQRLLASRKERDAAWYDLQKATTNVEIKQ
jgi:hypothetical protein